MITETRKRWSPWLSVWKYCLGCGAGRRSPIRQLTSHWTEPTKIRIMATGATGICVAKYQTGTITQRNSSRFWVPLSLALILSCTCAGCPWDRAENNWEKSNYQKILETTQASAMFCFQPMSMGSSNECPWKSSRDPRKITSWKHNKLNIRGKSILNPPLQSFRISLE